MSVLLESCRIVCRILTQGISLLSVLRLLNEWDHFMEMFRMEMMAVYSPDTVEEWMEENVNQYMDLLHSLAKDVEHIVKLKGQPKRV